MITICGVRFKRLEKVYYFAPGDIELKVGDMAVVETSRGVELGEVVIAAKEIEPSPDREIKPVLRKATDEDIARAKDNAARAEKALAPCRERIARHKLDMKLVDAEYTFDGSKLVFFFTSDGRVDFRELVKDLASFFRARIELRQIGVRDESKKKGGLGICGRPFCCASHMGEFHPVSIKMAKEQGLSLNPTKISGTCGRLMCCLKHEQPAYDELIKSTPRIGALVDTPSGRGIVSDMNILRGELKIKLGKEVDAPIKSFHKSEVTVVKDGKVEKLNVTEKELLDLEK